MSCNLSQRALRIIHLTIRLVLLGTGWWLVEFGAGAQALSSVTLAWDPSPSSGVTGYRVYWGYASRNYTGMLDAGNATQATVSGITPGVPYYFAVTDYAANGQESDYSSEISCTVPISSPPAPVALGGIVAYNPMVYPASGLSATRVGNVTMTVTGGTSQSATTASDGSYDLSGMAAGGAYCVTPSKTEDNPTANGVTVADLALIQRHVLGIAPLDSPYKLLAADVNTNGSITVADLGLIQRLILGTTNRYPAGLWRFVPTNYVFPDPQHPWNAPGQSWYTNLAGSVANGDFVAIKLGDVNNTWKAPTGALGLGSDGAKVRAKSAVLGPEVLFVIGQQSAQPGQVVTVGVSARGFRQVTSAQFSLAWDPGVLRYVGIGSYGLKGLSAGTFGTSLTESGKLAFAWYDPEAVGVTLEDGTVIFNVSFEVIGKTGSVSTVALAGSPTPQEVGVDFGLATCGAQDGSVVVVGPVATVGSSVYAKGVFRLLVPTEKGRLYSLEFTDSLAPTNWTALPAVVGDGTVKVLVDPAATNHQRFYRVTTGS